MEDRLEAILIWLEQAVQTTGDFLSEQTPLVVQEVIIYHRAFYTTVMVGLILFITWLVIRTMRNKKRWWVFLASDNDSEETIAVANLFAIPVIGGIVSTIVFFVNFPDFLKVWFAPRLFLLEWAKKFF